MAQEAFLFNNLSNISRPYTDLYFMNSEWNRRMSVSKQEPNGAWSNSLEFEAWVQGKLLGSGSGVVDMGDWHDLDKGAGNGNNKTADRMA